MIICDKCKKKIIGDDYDVYFNHYNLGMCDSCYKKLLTLKEKLERDFIANKV